MRLRVFLVLLGTACSSSDRSSQSAPTVENFRRQVAITGARLDSVALIALNGSPSVIVFPAAGPTILFVFDEEDCLSCINLPYEAWQAESWVRARGGRVLGVVATRDLQIPSAYARRTRLPFSLLADTGEWSQQVFGMGAHPMMVLLAPDGTILSTALRTQRLTEERLIGRFLAAFTLAFPVP